MTQKDKENVLHCLKVMIDEEVCEECNLYGTTGTDHCEKDCVRMAIEALQMEPCEDIKDALHIAQTDRDKWKARAEKLAKIIGIRDCDIDQYKQEPCEDCISRQQALHTFGLSDKTRKYGGDHSGYDTIMLYEVQIALEELPSVTPVCEEREKGECPFYAG